MAVERERKARPAAPAPAPKPRVSRAKLSFAADELDDDDGAGGALTSARPGKDPSVDASFLPDAAREAEEEALRATLAAQWDAEQARIKDEPMVVTFSYWDGRGTKQAISKGGVSLT